MPYIKHASRLAFECPAHMIPGNAGQLNYAITKLLVDYISTRGVVGLSYQSLNDALGALEGAKLEFYRRIAAPYEDTKIQENGDVYR
jgi:hypothetical protein